MPRLEFATYQKIAIMNSNLNRVISEAVAAKIQISGQIVSMNPRVGRYVDEKV